MVMKCCIHYIHDLSLQVESVIYNLKCFGTVTFTEVMLRSKMLTWN